VAYVRMVKTASWGEGCADGAVESRGSREIEHLGSAHDEAELEPLKAAARQLLAAGLGELRPRAGGGGVGPIVGTHFGVLVGRVVAGCQQFLEDRTGWTIK
jgi:hypothetical protein